MEFQQIPVSARMKKNGSVSIIASHLIQKSPGYINLAFCTGTKIQIRIFFGSCSLIRFCIIIQSQVKRFLSIYKSVISNGSIILCGTRIASIWKSALIRVWNIAAKTITGRFIIKSGSSTRIAGAILWIVFRIISGISFCISRKISCVTACHFICRTNISASRFLGICRSNFPISTCLIVCKSICHSSQKHWLQNSCQIMIRSSYCGRQFIISHRIWAVIFCRILSWINQIVCGGRIGIKNRSAILQAGKSFLCSSKILLLLLKLQLGNIQFHFHKSHIKGYQLVSRLYLIPFAHINFLDDHVFLYGNPLCCIGIYSSTQCSIGIISLTCQITDACHQHFLLASFPYIQQSAANTGSYKGCDYHTYYNFLRFSHRITSFPEAHRHGS